MTPKELRIIERNLSILLTDKAYKRISSIDDLKELGIFPEKIRVNKTDLFLNNNGIASLKQVTKIILKQNNLDVQITFDEAYYELKDRIQIALLTSKYDLKEFVTELLSSLERKIKNYTALYCIKGIDFIGDSVEIGNSIIIKNDKIFFDNLSLHKNIHPQEIYETMNSKYWLVLNEKGGKKIAKQNLEYKSALIEGMLSVYAIIFYKNAIQNCRVQVQNEYSNNSKSHSILVWPLGNTIEATHYMSFANERLFNFNQDMLNNAKLNLFFDQYGKILDKEYKFEIEECIVRSTYWIAESIKDNNKTMKFIKLWTEIECFFSTNSCAGAFQNGGIVELNATGLSTILTYGPYKLIENDKYINFKKNIKKLYTLRSKTIHAGYHKHISDKDLNDLSYWAAYLLVSLVALSELGNYKKLNDIYKKSDRLNGLSS